MGYAPSKSLVAHSPYRNVVDAIVSNGVCIGCGVCAGICPANALTMEFNRYGEYVPVQDEAQCLGDKCGICLGSCPFWSQEENEDTLAKAVYGSQPDIKHRAETGYYLETYVGHSNVHGHRENGASGGLTTWFLERLLFQGIVDRVVCVRSCEKSDRLFEFTILDKPEDVRQASRSCYYPVELSEVFRKIQAEDRRYVIVGLPCFLKGIRLAMRKNPHLRERVVVLAGLVCGQMQSKRFAEYVCALGGGEPSKLERATFRVKDPMRPATDYGLQFQCSDGPVRTGTVFWTEGMAEAWHSGYFRPGACDYCDDVFAELGDVVLMDAWLPQYKNDPKGTNLILVRSHLIQGIFEQGRVEGEINLSPIDVGEVIESQRGVLNKKRTKLAQLLKLSIEKRQPGDYLPRKRVQPVNRLYPHKRVIIQMQSSIRDTGRQICVDGLTLASPGNIQSGTKKMKFLSSGLLWGLSVANLLRAVIFKRIK